MLTAWPFRDRLPGYHDFVLSAAIGVDVEPKSPGIHEDFRGERTRAKVMTVGPTLRTLTFLHHGIGDLLLALPLLRSLKDDSGNHGCHRVVVKGEVERSVLEMAELGPEYDVGVFPRKDVLRFAMELRKSRPKYLLSPVPTGDWRMTVLARMIGARCSVGPEGRWSFLGFTHIVPSPWNRPIHKVWYFLNFGEKAGFKAPSAPEMKITVPAGISRSVAAELALREDDGAIIILASGSGLSETHKRWPPDGFARLAESLMGDESVERVFLLGSPDERTEMEEIKAQVGERLTVYAPVDIRRAFALLGWAHCVVANCAGPSHMAAAVGSPIVGLYGPTNALYTGPFSNKLRVVRRGLACSPCYCVTNTRGCGTPLCMTGLPVGEVMEAVRASLHGDPCSTIPWLPPSGATCPSVDR